MSFLRFLRWPNLLIVIITQYLLALGLIWPALRQEGLQPLLQGLDFALLVLVTVLIAAGGYVINDLYDQDIDRINKPGKSWVGSHYSVRQAWSLYWASGILGLLISVYLAWRVQAPGQLLIYPVAVAGLWAYSWRLKCTPLAGNVLVGLFCAFVAGILWYAERAVFAQLPAHHALPLVLGAYLVFAFISTLYREIIKDLEDRAGDGARGCRTLPVVYGLITARRIAFITGLLFLILCGVSGWWLFRQEQWSALAGLGAGVILPLIWSLARVGRMESQEDFHRQSQVAKWMMLVGLLLLFLLRS